MSGDSTSIENLINSGSTTNLLDPNGREVPSFCTVGDVVGEFTLQERLNGPSSIEAWRATSRGGNNVVLKVAQNGFNDEVLGHFAREHDGLNRARQFSNRIPRIHEYDLFAPEPYMAIEYIPGRVLRDVADENPSLVESLQIGRALCRIASDIHEGGVVHLDIKPGNSVVDPSGKVYLIDFDCAYVPEEYQTRKQDPLYIRGTPAFMSPEQMFGCTIPSAKMDLFALARVLNELISGVAILAPRSMSPYGMMRFYADLIRDDNLPRLAEVPSWFEPSYSPVLKSLAFSVDDRHDSAKDMIGDIESALSAAPLHCSRYV